ncbi:MAG TPA: ECF transporter S component [Oscillospiraceae bacterium]|mgnify:CR=1 FL=1|nr:ECF transporter S component [Oscillospiraceae bacterium]HPF56496.1 ECF transporter S component [Clostridiales bacterium]HPK36586.1 ECF transporter S component [Oscillospiraceae bacterium]HPR76796.1 ECF transporter S component [Oscillospiraceae bacterium]
MKLISNRTFTTRGIAVIGVLAALSIVLALFARFPLLVSYLEYEPGDIPILIGTFMFGPIIGLVLTAIVSLIQGFTVSASSGLYGILMHFIATGTLVLVSGMIYAYRKTHKGAVIALSAGAVSEIAVMLGANILITPLFLGIPQAEVFPMLLPIILPFNLIKCVINCTIAFFIYKPISRLVNCRTAK